MKFWLSPIPTPLKHFESDCFITGGEYALDIINEYKKASKASFKAQVGSGLGILSTIFHESYLG